MVDLMLPLTKDALQELDKTIQKREEIMANYIDASIDDSLSMGSIQQVRNELDVVDNRIRDLIEIDGGFIFLKRAQNIIGGWNIAIFSAQDQRNLNNQIPQYLQGNGLFEWLHKPVNPDKILALFRELEEG